MTPTPFNQQISRYTNTALSHQSATLSATHRIGENIERQVRHQGSLVDMPTVEGKNLWATAEYGESTHHGEMHRDYTKKTTLAQLGVDTILPADNGQMLLGGAFSQSRSEDAFDDGVRADTRLNLTTAYARLQAPSKSFADFDLSVGSAQSTLKMGNEQAKINQTVAMAGATLGAILQTPVMDITPSVGVRHRFVAGKEYTLGGAKTTFDDANVTSVSAGLAFEKSFELGNGVMLKPSLSSTFTKSDSKAGLTMNDTHSFEQGFGEQVRHELGVGLISKSLSARLYASHQDGKNQDKTQSAGVQVNFRW